MVAAAPSRTNRGATIVPIVALLLLAVTWGRDLPGWLVAVAAVFLAGAVLSAVHHAEVVAHRVGEPFGSLVLAVAVTVIEVGLIITLMISAADGAPTLARDTVFAAVMITCNGIVGISLVRSALRRPVVVFNPEGAGAALAAVATLATLSLVVPTFTTSSPGPTFTSTQLAFAAVASLGLYALFVFVQTVRHRDYFLPVPDSDDKDDSDHFDEHADPPTARAARTSLAVLVVALVGVVGLAKVVSPTIEDGVREAGLPLTVVGVVIALLVLLPEALSAYRAAMRNRVQTSFNLAYGSAMASIGLTIPSIAVASIWLDDALELGLGPIEIVLLAITTVVSVLTVTPGRATLLQGGVHLVLFAAFIVLAVSP